LEWKKNFKQKLYFSKSFGLNTKFMFSATPNLVA